MREETPAFESGGDCLKSIVGGESDNLRTVIVKTSQPSTVLEHGFENSSQLLLVGRSINELDRGTVVRVSEDGATPERARTHFGKGSRNPRFNEQHPESGGSIGKRINCSSSKDKMSLEERLRDEEIESGSEAAEQSKVSRQRVRQVPVSSTPKPLQNLSSSSQKREGSNQSFKFQALDSGPQVGSFETAPKLVIKKVKGKALSLEQDSQKKNVYHIFGRQTSDSLVSMNVQSEIPVPHPVEKADAGSSVVNLLSNHESSSKRHRKLLFNLNKFHPSNKTDFHIERVPPQVYGTVQPVPHHQHTMSIPIKKEAKHQGQTVLDMKEIN